MTRKIKGKVCRNRYSVSSYLSERSLQLLNEMSDRLDMSASDILETGLAALHQREMLLGVLSYEVDGSFDVTKQLLKASVILDIQDTKSIIQETKAKLELEVLRNAQL